MSIYVQPRQFNNEMRLGILSRYEETEITSCLLPLRKTAHNASFSQEPQESDKTDNGKQGGRIQ